MLTFLGASPDYTLYRYLKARDWKFDAARDMIVETMKVRTTASPSLVFFGTFCVQLKCRFGAFAQWRADFKPDEITTDMIASSIRIGGMVRRVRPIPPSNANLVCCSARL